MNECEEKEKEETVAVVDGFKLLISIIIHKRLINRLEADSLFHKHQIRIHMK